MGWGQTATSNFSPVLKENLFTAISDSMCEEFYQAELDSSILCTRDVPGQSICQAKTFNFHWWFPLISRNFEGDSGSSIGKIENERFVLYGLASFTSDSCLSGYPNSFTEIQPHMDFI